jgi:hypothetical protein
MDHQKLPHPRPEQRGEDIWTDSDNEDTGNERS